MTCRICVLVVPFQSLITSCLRKPVITTGLRLSEGLMGQESDINKYILSLHLSIIIICMSLIFYAKDINNNCDLQVLWCHKFMQCLRFTSLKHVYCLYFYVFIHGVMAKSDQMFSSLCLKTSVQSLHLMVVRV